MRKRLNAESAGSEVFWWTPILSWRRPRDVLDGEQASCALQNAYNFLSVDLPIHLKRWPRQILAHVDYWHISSCGRLGAEHEYESGINKSAILPDQCRPRKRNHDRMTAAAVLPPPQLDPLTAAVHASSNVNALSELVPANLPTLSGPPLAKATQLLIWDASKIVGSFSDGVYGASPVCERIFSSQIEDNVPV